MIVINHSNLYESIGKKVLSHRIRQFMCEFPSLFNYGTQDAIGKSYYGFHDPDIQPSEIDRGKQIFSEEAPLQLFGINSQVRMSFVFQLMDIEIDFFRRTVSPPRRSTLGVQQCAIGFKVFAAISCPLREFDPNYTLPDQGHDFGIPVHSVELFELEFLVVDAISVSNLKVNQNFSNGLQDIQMLNMKSNDSNNRFDQYIRALIDSVILPRAKLAIENIGYEVLDQMAIIGVFEGRRRFLR